MLCYVSVLPVNSLVPPTKAIKRSSWCHQGVCWCHQGVIVIVLPLGVILCDSVGQFGVVTSNPKLLWLCAHTQYVTHFEGDPYLHPIPYNIGSIKLMVQYTCLKSVKVEQVPHSGEWRKNYLSRVREVTEHFYCVYCHSLLKEYLLLRLPVLINK